MKTRIAQSDWFLIVILAVTIILRFLFLTLKAPHFDESTGGYFVTQIWQNGFYHYDPSNFHGPLFYYTLQFSELLFGFGIFALRFSPVMFSIGSVILMLMHRRFFGQAAVWAAAIMAVSPALVFYARYAIHESLFIFCQMLFSYGFWLWRNEKKSYAPLLMCVSLAADIATKETFFIFFGSWAIAWVAIGVYEGLCPSRKSLEPVHSAGAAYSPERPQQIWLKAIAIAVFALLFVFSGFGNDPSGIQNMIRAFGFWAHTGTASTGHEKPFFYWFKIMTTYEWATLFALMLTPIWLWVGSRAARLYALIGFGLWLAYSIIPYKTPWCIIGFIWPLALSLGFAIELARHSNIKWFKPIATAIAFILIAVSLCKTIRLNFFHYQDFSEPYVYVQAPASLSEIYNVLEARAELRPEDRNMAIAILSREGWPFPWLLHQFHRLNFGTFVGQGAQLIGDAPDFIEIDGVDQVATEALFKKKYIRRPLQLRDAYANGFAYYDFIKFQNLLPVDSVVVEATSPKSPAQQNRKTK